METKELRNLTSEELIQKSLSLKQELFALRESRYAAKMEKPHRVSQVKKDIARIFTILKERESQNVKEKEKNS
jgi:large subunit ribosomal protein L29